MDPADDSHSSIQLIARRARNASRALLSLSAQDKNDALQAVHQHLTAAKADILSANEADKVAAQERLSQGLLPAALVKRLDLSGKKFAALLTGVLSVRSLCDPVGQCSLSRELDQGLQLYRVACPIGVIAVIFEARPEAAVQIASLAIKSANAVILKGGKEAEQSNVVLVNCIRSALKASSVPQDAVQLVSTRDQVRELLDQSSYVDLVIPRGSNQLVRYITDNTRIPVMGHADGICAVYLDASADATRATDVVVDAKTQYPAVCNAAETLLVHRSIVSTVFPTVAKALAAAGVELRCDEASRASLESGAALTVQPSSEEDYDTEFLDLTMAVKVVASVDEAIEHINEHGSGHTDCVITEDLDVANRFMAMVDSASVFHNASTRFADGFRFGFGAEVGVSTHRTHSRGPVGLEGLMIYKYRLEGQGHTVAMYEDGERTFTHRETPDLKPY